MFCDKENINILTALLLKHGIKSAVVCPGSRNAPIVHNLSEAGMECHPVTDERSAGFYALGIALAKKEPVIVCVTSGSALLNLAPAVAEAAYQQCPIIVVSADRPAERIEQLDGQTIPQQGALGCFVGISVTLPEPHDSVSRSHCNRLVNEALIEARRKPCKPVHINVPITEPLFNFNVDSLPDERVIRHFCQRLDNADKAIERLQEAERPMIVVGQCPCSCSLTSCIETIKQRVVVLHEPLSSCQGGVPFDDVLRDNALMALPALNALKALKGPKGIKANKAHLTPDFILYIGNTIVSKQLKIFLRNAPAAETWAISEDGKIHDTFGNQTAVLECDAEQTMAAIAEGISAIKPSTFHSQWNNALAETAKHIISQKHPYSEELAVKTFEEMLERTNNHVHYANSTAVRLGCRHAKHYIYVNRGVNGIEGSLSTAAGFSLAASGKTFCVIGDLSFFYDSNALWNQEISGNLRILLLNNGEGNIFRTLPGLEKSGVRDTFVMGSHNTSAQGICQSYNIEYLSACDETELRNNMETFLRSEAKRPIVFEISGTS